MTPTEPPAEEPRSLGHPDDFGPGLVLGLVSGASFGLSGPLAGGLLDAGWTPTLAVTLRVTIGAVALTIPMLRALRGRYRLLREHARTIVVYGFLAVALPQACYFFAVQRLPVGPALLIEYVAPIVVLFWLWIAGGQRPTRGTIGGAVIAMVGLLLVLGLTTGRPLDPIGVLWASGSLVGAVGYWLISARPDIEVPPIALAGGGLWAGAAILWTLGLVGLLPLGAGEPVATYGHLAVPAPVALAALGVVSAAVSYAAGIAASRRLGSRLASFVGLSEVVTAFLFAWLLLGQAPGATQALGGVAILAGVTLVKLGEGASG